MALQCQTAPYGFDEDGRSGIRGSSGARVRPAAPDAVPVPREACM